MNFVALILADLDRARFGGASHLGDVVAGATVLTHTVRRAARVDGVQRVVIVHPPGQDPLAIVDAEALASLAAPLSTFASRALADDPRRGYVAAARAWSLTAWRGGLSGMIAHDELGPAEAMRDALDHVQADAAVLVGGAWCLFDDVLASRQLARHAEAPEAMKITFSQAPPGLGALVSGRETIERLAEAGATFGRTLAYNPRKPQIDPIGREVNLAVDPAVRLCARRFVYEFDRDRRRINALAQRLGPAAFADADALAVAQACHAWEAQHPDLAAERLPQQCVIELTPRRGVTGPIVPQSRVTFDRPDLDVDHARRLFEQLPDDAAVLLGGLGDAMLHPHWLEIARAAKRHAIAVGIETDLLCDEDELEDLLSGAVDVVTVRLNADTAAVYERVMGVDAFERVIRNVQWLLDAKHERQADAPPHRLGLPWIVPRLVKTHDTLGDMETFFERWLQVTGAAVIEPALAGCGLIEDGSPVPMTPPRRVPCRQLGKRLSILSDGTLAHCDQDWLGRSPLGDTKIHPLAELWPNLQPTCAAHREGRYHDLTLCGACTSWHRP